MKSSFNGSGFIFLGPPGGEWWSKCIKNRVDTFLTTTPHQVEMKPLPFTIFLRRVLHVVTRSIF